MPPQEIWRHGPSRRRIKAPLHREGTVRHPSNAMHEYSIIQSLMGRVEAEAKLHGAVTVHRIELSIGEQSGVEIDLLKTAFETFREGSICARAEMIVTAVPAVWRCGSCSLTLATGEILVCPECHAPAQLVAGDEIFLDRLEMEAA